MPYALRPHMFNNLRTSEAFKDIIFHFCQTQCSKRVFIFDSAHSTVLTCKSELSQVFLLRHDRLIGFTPPLTFNRSCNSALKALRRLLGQSLSLSVSHGAVVRTRGQWGMMMSVLYKRGAAGPLDARLSGAFGYESLASAKEEPCLIESGKRFTTSSPHPLPSTLSLFPLPSGMRKSPDVSPRRLSDISPQLRQLKYLVVDEAIKEDLKSSRSVEDINSASIEERILRITGYYGYQPWRASHTSESLHTGSLLLCVGGWVGGWSKRLLENVFLKVF